MRILIYGINFSPELTGVGKFTGELAEWLTHRGHEVRVICAPPYYPRWKIQDGYQAWRYRVERHQGMKIYRCPLYIPALPTGMKRLVHLFSFALSSLPVLFQLAIFWRPNLVWVVEPTFLCAPAAWLASRLSGAKAWLHIQDFEAATAFQLKLLPQGFIRTFYEWFERQLMRRFDRVSTISEAMMGRLLNRGLHPERTGILPNWVDTQFIYPLLEPSSFRKTLNLLDSQMVILYAGAMGQKQGLEILGQTAIHLSGHPNIQFVFCGEGAMRPQLQAITRDLPNVRFLPLQPLDKLNHLLNLADIHLVMENPRTSDLVMPSKLTGILASGRPVIAVASHQGELARVLQICGQTLLPCDSRTLADAILDLTGNSPKRAEMAQRSRDYALGHMCKHAILTNFEKTLDQMHLSLNGKEFVDSRTPAQ